MHLMMNQSALWALQLLLVIQSLLVLVSLTPKRSLVLIILHMSFLVMVQPRRVSFTITPLCLSSVFTNYISSRE